MLIGRRKGNGMLQKVLDEDCSRLVAVIISLLMCMASRAQTYEGLCDSLSDVSLPLVNLTVDIDKVSMEDYVTAQLDITDPQCRTNSQQTSHFRCKVKYRGASSLAYHKRSFAVKLTDDNDAALDASILGIRESDNWILRPHPYARPCALRCVERYVGRTL